MGLLDLGIGQKDPKVSPEDLGSGLLQKAAGALSGRALQLKQQECNAYGMDVHPESGACVRRTSSEPLLDE